MSLPESVSFPGDREKLFNALKRFDNGVTEEDVVGKESDYDSNRYNNTVLVQVLVDFVCQAFVKPEDVRQRLVQKICNRLASLKFVNKQLFVKENNEVRVAMKKKVFLFMKQVWNEVCPDVKIDSSILKYLESDNVSADFELYYRNNFSELKEIGQGGFGTVFKVKSKEDTKVYAVKKIFFSYQNDASFIKVMREIKNLSTLDHPNTISYEKAWLEIIPNGSNDSLNNSILGSSDDSCGESEDSETKGVVIKDASFESDSSDSIIFRETDSVENFKDKLPSMDSEAYTNSTKTDGTVSISEGDTESSDDNVAGFSYSFNFTVKGILYIQMEYCDCDLGLWLKKRAEGKELPFEMDIFSMFTDILNGIHYIHAKGIIHRDLKPHNIFYSSQENILKIGDFGLATLPQNPSDPFFGKTAKSMVHSSEVGTIPYAAPEQLKSKKYCTKVDMFSFGIILIELMNTCGTVSELVKVINDVKAGIITEEMKQFPKLVNLVKNLINHNPGRRMSATDVITRMMDEVKTSNERERKLQEEIKSMEKKIRTMEEKLKDLTEHISQLNNK